MTVDRSLTPDDATVAVRSFPRRFRAVFARPEEADERFDPDEAARRPGPDGHSAVEHLVAATTLLEAMPAFAPGDLVDDGSPIAPMLDRFTDAASSAVDRIGAVPSDDWSERLGTLQDAVGAVADHLRAASAAVRT
ncbi:hypothetical protein [Actinospongicola halichondriae]|uniref:hypothetical protein n=1 Tax=Actinospongicola halichondriae TaxID=3236844 RepID=UPI003D586427